MSAATILVVEDDDGVRRAVCRMLRMRYPRTEAVGSPGAALAWLAAAPVDLVLLDIRLSDDDAFPDGCALAVEIVRAWPQTRILFSTGYRYDLPVGCPVNLPVIVKPFTMADLLERVAAALVAPPWRPPPWGPI